MSDPVTLQDKPQLAAEFARLYVDRYEFPRGVVAFDHFLKQTGHRLTAALTEWAQQDDIRRRALDKAEDTCRARAGSIRNRVDYHASPTLVARAHEADECAEALARLKEEHD